MSSSIFFFQFCFRTVDHVQVWFGNRMFCYEDGTAVFEWLDGCLVGSDLPGSFNDFLFIEADNRAVYREGADFVGGCEAL